MKTKKLLIYSPYGLFTPHAMREVILAQRFIHRGYEITNIACDQKYNICDYKVDCTKCFNLTKIHLSESNFTTKFVSQYSLPEDQLQAEKWLASIDPQEYLDVTYENLKLGDWIRSSVHFMLKVSKLDFSNPLILKTYQQFLKEGFAFSLAAKRMLDETHFDKIVMTNGRFFSHRILLEIANLRKIQVVIHEYSYYYQTMQLQYGLISNSYINLSEKWFQSTRTPINLQALLHTHQIILDKRYRRRSPFEFFTPIPAKNSIPTSTKKKVLCALSSEYEFNASPDHPHIIGMQVDWMKLLIPEMEKYPDHHFIIKLHPNSEISIVQEMRDLFSGLHLPNCEILWPDTTVSTYDLIDQADYIMVYWSTVAQEAACAGKKVFCVNHCVYYGTPFLKSLSSAEAHSEELKDFLLDLSPIENLREEAYRFCYRYFIEQSIPFTPTSNPKGAVTIYNQPVQFYRDNENLPQDPYLDYTVDCMERDLFPDTVKINGSWEDAEGIQEKFFFKCMSLIQNFGDISFPKKKILILRKKSGRVDNHCFENTARLSLFEHSTKADWLAYLLLLDGHQVYSIDPDNRHLLEQWAHEYGAFSGSHNLKGILNSPFLFKIVSETLFKSPFLNKLGRKAMFLVGRLQMKTSSKGLLDKFKEWFQPDHTIHNTDQAFFGGAFENLSFDNHNLSNLMNHPQFDDSMRRIFTNLNNQLK
jgi:hypothetical protein